MVRNTSANNHLASNQKLIIKDNVSINKNLKSGYYLLYSFIDYNQDANNKDHFYYFIKIDSNIIFKIIKKPCDIKENDFPLLKYIKIQEYLYINLKANYSKEKGINYLIKYIIIY